MPSNKDSDKYKYVDFLTEDAPLANQAYVCLSFISPEGVKNCKTRGLKVRGVCATEEEAKARCAELNAIDPDFDVFIGEVGKWLPWHPDPAEAKNQVYREKELNEIVQGHHKNLNKAKQFEAERKTELLKKAITDEKSRKVLGKEQAASNLEKKENKQEFIDKAMEKLAEVGDTTDTDNTTNTNISKAHRKRLKNKLKKQNKLTEDVSDRKLEAEEERKRLHNLSTDINDEKNALDGVDKDIAAIKKLYMKLKEKQKDKQDQHNKQESA